jgi:hypothetical protein
LNLLPILALLCLLDMCSPFLPQLYHARICCLTCFLVDIDHIRTLVTWISIFTAAAVFRKKACKNFCRSRSCMDIENFR